MNKKYRLTQNQISTSLNNEAVILNTQKGMYYGLNEVGTTIWEFINIHKTTTFEDLLGHIIEHFDINSEQGRTDLEALLLDLKNEKLIEEVE